MRDDEYKATSFNEILCAYRSRQCQGDINHNAGDIYLLPDLEPSLKGYSETADEFRQTPHISSLGAPPPLRSLTILSLDGQSCCQ